jgi:hypothetical protein
VRASGDYAGLLRTVARWVSVIHVDGTGPREISERDYYLPPSEADFRD